MGYEKAGNEGGGEGEGAWSVVPGEKWDWLKQHCRLQYRQERKAKSIRVNDGPSPSCPPRERQGQNGVIKMHE